MNKRLCRATIDRKLCGVCGGFAHYFDVDSTLVRLIFALLILTGTSVLFYFLAALIMPESDQY